MYGGDGEDEIHAGWNWNNSRVEGENGDDAIYAPQKTRKDAFIYGGEGDDTVYVEDYDDVTKGDRNSIDSFFGQGGNDVISGTHFAKGQYLYGGDGHDKMYGGDA